VFVPSTVTDLRYGRRGGGWLPAGYQPPDVTTAAVCDVCGLPVIAATGPRHTVCEPAADELFPGA